MERGRLDVMKDYVWEGENKAFGHLVVVLLRDLEGLSVPWGLIMDAACFSFLFHTHNPEYRPAFTHRYWSQNGSEVVIHLNLHRNISYRQKAKCKQRPAHRYDAKGVVCIKLSDVVVIQCHYKCDYLLIRQRERFSVVHGDVKHRSSATTVIYHSNLHLPQ